MKKILATLALIVIIAAGVLFALASNTSEATDNNRLQVTASYYPLYDFAKNVGGDKVQVTNMTPAGAEPHDYAPAPKALANAQKSSVFVYNGSHLEPWTDNFVKGYSHTAIKANKGIELLGQDPHFWLDPVLAEQIVDTIQGGLTKADPANKSYYTAHAASYKTKLAKLDADYRRGLATCQLHTVISSHDAFSYLGKRYGLTILSIAGMSPEEEPSASKLAEISDIVRRQNIKYIFFESLVSPRLADTIARETGARTLVFDPLEGLTDADQKQGKDYLSVQYENLKNLRTALACE